MRLYIGFDLSDFDISQYLEIIDTNISAKHTNVSHNHLTLQFIGEVDEKYIDDLIDHLHRVKKREVEINIDGYGTFSNSIHFRVKPNLKLMSLQQDIFNQCEQFKEYMKSMYGEVVELSYTSFVPHITLTRLNEKAKVTNLELNIKKKIIRDKFCLFCGKEILKKF